LVSWRIAGGKVAKKAYSRSSGRRRRKLVALLAAWVGNWQLEEGENYGGSPGDADLLPDEEGDSVQWVVEV